MDPDLADLVPLFVAETRTRLERLGALLGRADDPSAAADVRRELHTIKGAARMLRLSAIADLCHATEGVLQRPQPESRQLVAHAVDRLAGMVDTVAGGAEPTPDEELLAGLRGEPAWVRADDATATPLAGELGATTGVRIEAPALADLTDEATHLRILTSALSHPIAHLAGLARLAATGARGDDATTVLSGLASTLRQAVEALDESQRRIHRLADRHLEVVLGVQIQPLKGFLLSLARHARELARSLGREIEVEVSGGETRLDRRIAGELEEALVHIVRNAVDHGIESPDARERQGKPRAGRLTFRAETVAGRVHLVIEDDGSGIDPEAVAAAATRVGVLDEGAAKTLTTEEAFRLLFLPGLSTRRTVTDLSGRGVGLDAVAVAIARAGGEVRLASSPGRGTIVVVDVPVTRRGEEVLLLRAGRVRVALPKVFVRWVAPLPPGAAIARADRTLARVGDRLLPFVSLSAVLGELPAPHQLLLGGAVAGQPIAIAVDAVETEEEVLVRSLPPLAGAGSFFEGVALTASGEPVGVLSAAMLTAPGEQEPSSIMAQPTPTRLRVLLVDDSAVTREMERRLLEDGGFKVAAVADGAAALARLSAESWDCLVTDVEMPGLDGLELTRQVRANPGLSQLPVVVLSTRDRPQDVMAGLAAGADAYLTKQTLDAVELVTLVRRLGGTR